MKLSTMNKDMKSYQAGLMFSLFLFGVLFMLVSMQTVVMAPEVWGSAIYAIPAEAWSFAIMAAATMSIYGIYKNGRSRWSPLWRVGGYSILLVISSGLAIMSNLAEYGSAMSLFAMTLIIPPLTVFIYINIGDVARACRGSE